MRFLRIFPAFLLTLTLLPAAGWAQRSCAEILYSPVVIQKDFIHTESEVSGKILKFMDLLGAGNTTSLRQEDKYVVSPNTVDRVIGILSRTYGDQFQLRDQKQEGRKNVTVTQYALPFNWKDTAGKSMSAKIRFRKYFDTDASVALGKAAMKPAEIVKDQQFVEFKIDHPLYDQVVIKPRMLMKDTDVVLIQDKQQFLQHRNAILSRTLELNPKVPAEVVKNFFEVFADVYSEPVTRLPLFATTAYVRDSYSLMLKNQEGKSIEIQLTIDREVNVQDSRSHKVVSAYRAEDVVVELKVPLAYSGLTAENFAQVPGLRDVLALKQDLQKNHVHLYAEGSGKLSTFKKSMDRHLDILGD